MATTIGDVEVAVRVAVEDPGTDCHHVCASLEDKANCTKESKKEVFIVPAGDGANDVVVSSEVITGSVTGVGMNAVTELVDSASTEDDLSDVAKVSAPVKKIHCKTT